MSSITVDFAEALSTIDRPGEFYASGTVEMPSPRLEVEGIGPIALPLLPVQAAQLIAMAERAPYGRGEATLTDTTVRRTWQIAPDRVRISGRYWPGTLAAILEQAAEGLGVAGTVETEFYKLLIYDQGSFFVRHRDTEKQAGMFATLILVLPSLSSGGELVVRHKEREVRLALHCEDPSEIAFAAFYADCVHEVLPVTAGYRLALVYNLVRRGPGPLPEPADHAPQQDVVAALLRDWAEGLRTGDADDTPEKLVLPLEHAYTPAELGFQALKGADAGIARVIEAAAHRAACDVHLALITVEENGAAEYTGHSRSRRGWHDDGELEAGDVDSRTVTASDWRRPDGEPSPLTELPVENEEFSPPDAFEDLEPDEEHFHEATGNEGASFERTYRRAALVLWPRDRLLAVINQAGLPVTLPYLADFAVRWEASGQDRDAPLWRQAHDLAAHMLASWSMEYWQPRRDDAATHVGQMLNLLTQLGDVANLDLFLTAIAGRGGLDLGDVTPIVDALRLLVPEHAASLATRIVAGTAEMSLAACGALLARAASLAPVIVGGGVEALVHALPDTPPPRDAWRRGPGVGSVFIVDLFVALASGDGGDADRAATRILASPAVYDFDTVLIPAVRELLGRDGSEPLQRLRRACVAHLSARVAEPLAAPTDWGRPSALTCSCLLCAEFSRFLADPVNPRWVFKANEAERSHVAGTILNARCDVDTTTDRRGRPYSLICTKNQASYERRRTQRSNDLANLERLGA